MVKIWSIVCKNVEHLLQKGFVNLSITPKCTGCTKYKSRDRYFVKNIIYFKKMTLNC